MIRSPKFHKTRSPKTNDVINATFKVGDSVKYDRIHIGHTGNVFYTRQCGTITSMHGEKCIVGDTIISCDAIYDYAPYAPTPREYVARYERLKGTTRNVAKVRLK